jgi:multidrug efflux pump subunit AcrA (membrane-fusion protein)
VAGLDQQQQQWQEQQQQQEQQLQQQQQEHQLQQQQQEQQLLQQQLLQQGNIVINTPSPDPGLITINTLTGPEVTPPKGSVATRIRQLEDASSPPAGHDMAALSGGLPAEPSEAWGDAPTVTRQLRASPPTPPVAPPTNHMDATLNSSSFSYTSMDHSSEITSEIDDFLKQDDEAMGDVDP